MMKILVTGGAGFVGCNLSLYFKEKGYEVTALDNLARRGSELNLEEFKEKGINFVHGDIRCKEDLDNLGKFDAICECSAQPSAIDGYNNPYYDFSNNTLGLINVLEYARKNDSIVIFWSTNKVYSGDRINDFLMFESSTRYQWSQQNSAPGWDAHYGFSNEFTIDGGQHSIYGMSKVMSDLACQEYFDAFGVRTVVNRFSCLAGPRQWGKSAQGWVAWWAIAAELDLPLVYIGWKGKQVRDALFVDDICKLVEAEIVNVDKVAGDVFNIGGGKDITLSLIEATNLMEREFKKKLQISILDNPRKADHCIYISDIRKIQDRIGWEPKVGVEEGYSQIIKWVKDNKDMLRKLYV
jgi:CDP-paratose 2-epimerase